MTYPVWKIKTFHQLTTIELYEILKIRQEVFIVEQTCFYLDADGADEKAVHIWAENEGKAVAYCRVFKAGVKYDECSIGRVLTHPNYRKLQLGKTLMAIAISTIENRFSSRKIRISAQDYLLKFYKEFGFQDIGLHYLEDDIPHTEMLRE
ncbi:GNAT family N-acetyltransferase [Chryseobacterium sp. MP_3.2]|uniref:GNAT family N-acetyltransferase n=1 Tax=Chryseobacterium sp. MP_3.2 TaxID=3071712 RepID=UPI002DF8B752|nr:ElaA protein [Chryseobacterium sp. MP_3.2]